MMDRKMHSGSTGLIGQILDAITDRINQMAERLADRIRGTAPAPTGEDPTAGMYNGRWYPSRAAADAAEGDYNRPVELVPVDEAQPQIEDMQNRLEILRGRIDKYTAEYEDVRAEASRINEIVATIGEALTEATADIESDRASDIAVLTERVAKYTEQWNALVDRLREIKVVLAALQDEIDKLDGDVKAICDDLDRKSPRRLQRKALRDILARFFGVDVEEIRRTVEQAIAAADRELLEHYREVLRSDFMITGDPAELQEIRDRIDEVLGEKSAKYTPASYYRDNADRYFAEIDVSLGDIAGRIEQAIAAGDDAALSDLRDQLEAAPPDAHAEQLLARIAEVIGDKSAAVSHGAHLLYR